MVGGFETSKPALRDGLPAARPHLLNLPKQSHQWGLRIETVQAYEGCSQSKHCNHLKNTPVKPFLMLHNSNSYYYMKVQHRAPQAANSVSNITTHDGTRILI